MPNKEVLIGRHGSQHIVKMSQGVAIGDDLPAVSGCNPSTAKLFEERWCRQGIDGVPSGAGRG